MASIEEELRSAPLTQFTDNLIVTTAANENAIYVWEPKTLAILSTYQVISQFLYYFRLRNTPQLSALLPHLKETFTDFVQQQKQNLAFNFGTGKSQNLHPGQHHYT